GAGKGHIAFTIRPLAGLPSGTEIRNVGLITFDGQQVIATNQIDPADPAQGTDPAKEALTTIDAEAPSSHVLSMSPTTVGEIEVQWTGNDGSGSGVASFDVYVSIDGGPYELWLDNTPDTSALYSGAAGATYAFYSVAVDHVGHVELPPLEADAETQVVASGAGSILLVSDVWLGGTALVVTGTQQDDNVGIEPAAVEGMIHVVRNGETTTIADPTGRIIV